MNWTPELISKAFQLWTDMLDDCRYLSEDEFKLANEFVVYCVTKTYNDSKTGE